MKQFFTSSFVLITALVLSFMLMSPGFLEGHVVPDPNEYGTTSYRTVDKTAETEKVLGQVICPPDITVNSFPGQCDAYINIPLPDVSPSGGQLVNNYNFTANASDYYPVGPPITVTYSYIAPLGDTSFCSFEVQVWDVYPPIAMCKDITVSLDPNGTLFLSGNELDNGSFDNCFVAYRSASPENLNCSNLGNNEVVLTVIDESGNEATCVSSVFVQDNTDPIITCPDDLTISIPPGESEVVVNYATPVVFEACTFNLECDPMSGSLFLLGTTPVNCLAIDQSGNQSECSFSVTVEVEQGGAPEGLCGKMVSTFFGKKNKDYVLGIFNTEDCGSYTDGPGWNWDVNTHYPAEATVNRMGQLFGLCIDSNQCIYATASTIFGDEEFLSIPSHLVNTFGTAGAGGIYQICLQGGVWDVEDYVTTSNTPNTVGTTQIYNLGSGLGNICYDKEHDQFFASNFQDGLIYRIAGTSHANPGEVLSTFGHAGSVTFPNKPLDPNFIELGLRIWGVGVYNGTLYYSVWNENQYDRNDINIHNEVHSVGLDGSGNFLVPLSANLEITLPDYGPFTPGIDNSPYSSPVSDIAFSTAGKMLLAERSMLTDMGNAPYRNGARSFKARMLEYTLNAGSWQLNQTLYVGNWFWDAAGHYNANSAGGCDYGYGYKANHALDQEKCDSMIWGTGDRLEYAVYNSNPSTQQYNSDPLNKQQVFGLAGIPATGNSRSSADADWVASTSWYIDVDKKIMNTTNGNTAEWMGDVEIFKCGCISTPLFVQCDSIQSIVSNFGSTDSCCWSLSISNQQPEPIVRITASISPGSQASFDQNIVVDPDVMLTSPLTGTSVSLTHTNGSFPQGMQNLMNYCLISNPGQSVTLEFKFYALNALGQEELVCTKTEQSACEKKDDKICTELIVDSIYCQPDQLSYQVWFSLVNYSTETIKTVTFFPSASGDLISDPNNSGSNTHKFIPYLSPGTTSPSFVMNVTPNDIYSLPSLCFQIVAADTTGYYCCHDDEDYCVDLVPCCDPCEDRYVMIDPGGSSDSTCCYSLDLGVNCPRSRFVSIETEVITNGVEFGSHYISGPDFPYWHNPQSTPKAISWEHLDGSEIHGNYPNLINFCLNDITSPGEVPQEVVIRWYEQSTSGTDSLACTDTLLFQCPPPVQSECFEFTVDSLYCQSNGEYHLDFTVTNLTPFDVSHFAITGITVGSATISPSSWNQTLLSGGTLTDDLTISGGQPGEHLCFEARLFDLDYQNMDTLFYCCFDTFCIDLPNCSSCCPLTSTIESIELDACVLTMTPGDIDTCERYDWRVREWVNGLPGQTICSQINAGWGSFNCVVPGNGDYEVCLITIGMDNGIVCEDDTCAIISVQGCGGDPCCPVDANVITSVTECTVTIGFIDGDTCVQHDLELFPVDVNGNPSGPPICSELDVSGNIWTCQVPASGKYGFCHIVKVPDANGNILCSDTLCSSVIVNNCDTCAVSFNWNIQDSCGKVQFMSQTGGQNPNYSWDLGDGTTSSDPNPMHVYASSGPFTVCLTVTDGNCVSTTCQTINNVVFYPPPVMSCLTDVTVDISNGQVIINVGDVDLGSYGYCLPEDLWLDRTTFDCSDACQNIPVHLIGQDCCGNQAMCEIVVHVSEENVPPVIMCPPDITLGDNDPFNPGSPTYSDNCDNDMVSAYMADLIGSGDCPIIEFQLTWTVTDDCMNSASCIQHLTLLCDSLRTGCDQSYNLVTNGTFGGPWGPTGSHESIGGATGWGAIWNNGTNVGGTGDLWNTIFTPTAFIAALQSPIPNTAGNYAGFWVSNSQNLTEGIMNQLVAPLPQEDACYEINFDVACLLQNGGWGNTVLDVYGCQATGFGTGLVTMPNPTNLALFQNTVLLGSFTIPSGCDNTFTPIPPGSMAFNASTFPPGGIDHIFFTRSNGTMGGEYIGLDNVCLYEVPCNSCPCPITGVDLDVSVTNCEATFTPIGMDENCDEVAWSIYEQTVKFVGTPPFGQFQMVNIYPAILTGTGNPTQDWSQILEKDGFYAIITTITRVTENNDTCVTSFTKRFSVSGCTACVCDIEPDVTSVTLFQNCNAITLTSNSLLTQCDKIVYDFGDFTGDMSVGPGDPVNHVYAQLGDYTVKYKIFRDTPSGEQCDFTGTIPIKVLCFPYSPGGSSGIILNPNFTSGLKPGPLTGGGNIDNWYQGFGNPIAMGGPGCSDPGSVFIQTLDLDKDGIIQNEVPFSKDATYYFELCLDQITADYNVDDGFDPLPRMVLQARSSDPTSSACDLPECITIGASSMVLESGFLQVAFPGWKPNGDYDRLSIAPGWHTNDTSCINGITYPFKIDNIVVYEVTDCVQKLDFNSLTNRTLGGACLEVVGGELRVSQIDTSLTNGVQVDFGLVDEAVIKLKEDYALLDQPGSSLEVAAYGESFGSVDLEMATARFVRNPSGTLGLYVSNDMLGMDSSRIVVLQDGNEVQAFNVNAGFVGDLAGVTCCDPGEIRSDAEPLNFSMPPFTLFGASGNGLSIQPYLDNGFQGVSRITIKAANLPEDQFVIVVEEGKNKDCTRYVEFTQDLNSAREEACLTDQVTHLEVNHIGSSGGDGVLVEFVEPNNFNVVDFYEPLLLDSFPGSRASFTSYGNFATESGVWIQTIDFNQTSPGVIDLYGYANSQKASGFTVELYADKKLVSTIPISGNYLGQIKGPDGFTGGQADPIPGVDIALEQIPGGINFEFVSTFTFSNGIKADELRVLPEFKTTPLKQTHLEILAANIPGELFTIVDEYSDETVAVQPPGSGDEWNDVRIHPNPVSGKLYLDFNAPLSVDMKVRILDIHGRLVSERFLKKHVDQDVFDTAGWHPGWYMMVFVSEDGYVGHRKFVKVE